MFKIGEIIQWKISMVACAAPADWSTFNLLASPKNIKTFTPKLINAIMIIIQGNIFYASTIQ